MKVWWLTDTARFAEERASVAELAAVEGWFHPERWHAVGGCLTVEGTIMAHDVRYPIRLRYPDQFPFVPAWVEPQDREALWSGHQYGKGGSLCLELRPDNWRPQATGADVLRSAYNLLHAENPLGKGARSDVPSADAIGEVQAYDWFESPVLVSQRCFAAILDGSAAELRAVRWMAADNIWPIFMSDAPDRAGARRPPSADLGSWRFELPVLVSRAGIFSEATPPTRDELGEALGISTELEGLAGQPVVVVAVADGVAIPFHSPAADTVYRRRWVPLSDETGARSGRSASSRGKWVAIVGLGSVGSKVAEILLRSGIDHLVLVDGDVFLPGNLERHTLDWRDVGFRKAHAVRRRLLHIAPGADIEILDENLDWQRSARRHAIVTDMIACCDLIFDATGDAPTSLLLGALAAENSRSLVSAEIFEGGLGILVARSVPGLDPAYASARASLLAYCEQMNVRPPEPGPRRYEALSESGTPIVADDAAVTVGAAHAARVALDVLDGAIDEGAAAWMLLGLRRGWLFRGHGHVISLDVGKPSSLRATANFGQEDIEFALALAKEALDATADPG